MEKEILKINGRELTIMEQPASFILELERKYTNMEIIEYINEFLKYPSGVNPKVEEVINIPEILKTNNLELSLKKEDGKIDYKLALEIFMTAGVNPAFTGEFLIKKLNKSVDDFKYTDLINIGSDIIKQLKELVYLVQVRDVFRRL